MQRWDDRTSTRRTSAPGARGAARVRAATGLHRPGFAAGPPAPSRARTARLVAAAGGLALAGCSGIARVEETCAPHRARASTFAGCLHSNYAVLTGGPPAERDLALYYLATADEQADRVARGEATNAQAMLALARFRATELMKMEQERQATAFKQMMDFMQSQKKDSGSSGSDSGSALSASTGGGGSPYQIRR